MKNGNECSKENVWGQSVRATAGNLPICGTVVQGHAERAAKKLGKRKFGGI